MPREFDGTSSYDLTGSAGSLVGMDAGPITLVAVVKLNSTSTDGALIYCGGGAETGVDLELYGGSYYMASQEPALAAASTSDGWHLVGATKAAGTATPRFHKHVFSTGAWTHSDAGSTMGDGVAVAGGDTLRMGRWGTASMRLDGAIAIAGVWDRVLTDAEIEQLAFTVQAWYGSAPREGWLLDQADTGVNIVSFTGGGANFTGGAALVSTDSGPGISYGFPIILNTPAPSGGGAVAGSGTGAGVATSTAGGVKTVASSGRCSAAAVGRTSAVKVTPSSAATTGGGAATGAGAKKTASTAATTTVALAHSSIGGTAAGSGSSIAAATTSGAGLKLVAASARCAATVTAAGVAAKRSPSAAATHSIASGTGSGTRRVAGSGRTAATAIAVHLGADIRAASGRCSAVCLTWARSRVTRPNSGVIIRPSSGTIAAPNSGVILRP